jgi:hypothetical protein
MASNVMRQHGPAGGAAPCFVSGTRLLGPAGEVAVEQLRPGEPLVALRHGGLAAVRWVGRRTLLPARHPQPHAVAPVRIHAGAFGPGVPHRDLALSPGHAVHLSGAGVLVPVRHLLNGSSIRQEPGSAAVTYFHVELAGAAGAATHDILLAEGLAAESCLDTGCRANFANGGPVIILHPTLACRAPGAMGCAPLVSGGPAVAAARERLQERARVLGWRLSVRPRTS